MRLFSQQHDPNFSAPAVTQNFISLMTMLSKIGGGGTLVLEDPSVSLVPNRPRHKHGERSHGPKMIGPYCAQDATKMCPCSSVGGCQ